MYLKEKINGCIFYGKIEYERAVIFRLGRNVSGGAKGLIGDN